MPRFAIGKREVGQDCPCLIIAEVAQAHEGSVNVAHAFVDAIAEAGADAVKFQTHIAAAESSPGEPWRVRFSRQDASRFDYWKRMEFSREQWRELKRHAEERGLIFLSSPFSLAAVELLLEIGVGAWKVASGEVRNGLLLERLIGTRLPVLVSSGMSGWAELDGAMGRLAAAEVPRLVFQCTTAYPCPPDRVGLNLLGEIRARYGCEAGLSDHSGTIWPALAATALGAKAIEVHVTWDRTMFGPDVPASVTFGELKQLVAGVRFTESMLLHPVDKDVAASGMGELRRMFGQALVAARPLSAGTVLKLGDLATRKPEAGIPAGEFQRVLGARTARDIREGEFLQFADIRS